MPIRHGHRPGRHLVKDDESDIIYYDDEVTVCWDGSVRHEYEGRQPQEFVRAKRDPYPVSLVRPDELVVVTALSTPSFVGLSSVPTMVGPGTHLYRGGKFTPGAYVPIGIDDMVIEDPGAGGFVIE